jgi:hypothetical protein
MICPGTVCMTSRTHVSRESHVFKARRHDTHLMTRGANGAVRLSTKGIRAGVTWHRVFRRILTEKSDRTEPTRLKTAPPTRETTELKITTFTSMEDVGTYHSAEGGVRARQTRNGRICRCWTLIPDRAGDTTGLGTERIKPSIACLRCGRRRNRTLCDTNTPITEQAQRNRQHDHNKRRWELTS